MNYLIHIILQLFQLVQKFMCIPATSTPSERLFSLAGFIVNARRNKLTVERMNRLIFLHNLKDKYWKDLF